MTHRTGLLGWTSALAAPGLIVRLTNAIGIKRMPPLAGRNARLAPSTARACVSAERAAGQD